MNCRVSDQCKFKCEAVDPYFCTHYHELLKKSLGSINDARSHAMKAMHCTSPSDMPLFPGIGMVRGRRYTRTGERQTGGYYVSKMRG